MQAATPAVDFDARFSRVEGIIERLSQRLATLETRVDGGFRDLHTRLYWIIGIQFTTFIALGTLILFKL